MIYFIYSFFADSTFVNKVLIFRNFYKKVLTKRMNGYNIITVVSTQAVRVLTRRIRWWELDRRKAGCNT